MKKTSLYMLTYSCMLMLGVSSCKSSADLTLKSALKNDFLIGVAMNSPQIYGRDVKGDKMISTHFNSIVAENCMKSEVLHPQKNKYNFREGDELVNFGEKNNMVVMGHVLVWHSQLPRWFCVDDSGKTVSRDTLINRMRDHIYTVMHHFKGKVKGWDVVNEAFEDDGSYRKTPFYTIIGEDYIPLAFKFAHEADPDAELYYNDFSMFKPAKCDAVVRMVQKLKSMGLKIDAVGMQGHYLLDDPDVSQVETSIVKLASAGVKVNITEFDLSVLQLPQHYMGADVNMRSSYQKSMNPYADGKLPEDVQKKWNEKMIGFFKIFLAHKSDMRRVTFWGLSDKDSWKNNWPIPGRIDFPLLFDREDNPKPIVKMIINEVKRQKK